jgi:serine protease Do
VSAAFGEIVEKLRRSTVQVSSGGSGVLWSPDGRIVTNAHVVEGSDTVEISLWDGRRLPGTIVRRDRRRDLAVLQVQASGLPSATPGDSNALRVGEFVVAVGNPLGFIGAASTGVVHRFETRSWVVSQLRLAPGNSGGPLANARGEVVGINTMIAGGLAFAVPSKSVIRFLSAPHQEQYGLGVVVRPVQFGLIVLELIPHSPADRASLLQGDILVGAFGQRFQSVQDLEIAIHGSLGGILELQFRRGASASIRTVAAQMAPASVRAA